MSDTRKEPRFDRQAVGLEIGPVQTRCMVAEKVDGDLYYRGHAQLLSNGMVSGRVIDGSKAKGVVDDCLRRGGWDGESRIRVGVGGWDIKTRVLTGALTWENTHKIRLSDMGQVPIESQHRREFPFGELCEWQWIVDGKRVRDLHLMEAHELAIEKKIVSIGFHRIKDMYEATEPLMIGAFELEPVASLRSVYSAEQDGDDILVIEIRDGYSAVTRWKGGKFATVDGVMRGVTHMVRDVAFELNLPFDKIVRVCETLGFPKSETLSLEGFNREGSLYSDTEEAFSRKAVDFIDFIRELLVEKKVVLDDMPGRLVLTGGMNWILERFDPERISEVLGIPETRIGYPWGIEGSPDFSPEWSVAYGLVLLSGESMGLRPNSGASVGGIRIREP